MTLDPRRAGLLSGGVWLIGFGLLLYTNAWWPGILFLIGVESLLQGPVRGRGRYALQGGLWLIGFGVWALLGYDVAVLFVALGASLLLSALARPPVPAPVIKPPVDTSFE